MSRGWMTPRDAWPALLAHTPSGWAWSGFRVPGKTAYRFWKAVSSSLTDAWQALYDMAREVDYRTGTQFIGEWQEALSLPDPCLPQAATVEAKRAQIEFRLSKRRWTTKRDYEDLAALFGLTVTIIPGWCVQKPALFDQCLDAWFFDFEKLGRFRVYIDITGCAGDGFDYDYDYDFPADDPNCSAYMCLIERVKPANVVIFWNQDPVGSGWMTCGDECYTT